MSYTLSYIVSTRNRIQFLQIILPLLFANIQPDEEIIVVDSNSTDGTQDYLNELHSKGKIHKFISEPDKNQAHGWNKAILMAEGEIIKKIIDDDLFCFSAIQKCKNYMLTNKSIDVCISNTLTTNLNKYQTIEYESRRQYYLQWKLGKVKSFTFGDVSMLIRRSSIAYIGLYNTSFIMMDYEFSLRISYLRANIAYHTGFNAMSLFNTDSVSSKVLPKELKIEGIRANTMYEYSGDQANISPYSKLKIFIGKMLYRLGIWQITSQVNQQDYQIDLREIYRFCYEYLNSVNECEDFTFL